MVQYYYEEETEVWKNFFRFKFDTYIQTGQSKHIKRQPRVKLVVLVLTLQLTGWLVLEEHSDKFQYITVIPDINDRDNHHLVTFSSDF